ncbi:MAG: C25 family peptidase propeptide domain-containing protein, partial [Solirubrobacteraceae bacterium]
MPTPPYSDPPPVRAHAATAAAVVALLLTPAAAHAAPANPTTAKAASPLTAATKALKAEVGKLPHESRAQRTLRARLTTRAAAVSSQAKSGHLCSAKTASKGLRLQVKSTKAFSAKQRAAVTGAALQVETRLLSLPGAARCGGVTTAPAAGGSPVTSVLTSTPQEMKVSVALPAVQLEPKTGGGKTFTEATMPGTTNAGATGGPSVPTVGQSFAIPSGATVSVSGQESSSYTLEGVDLYPTQKSAVDAPGAPVSPHDKAFADKPFTQDAKAYASGKPFPAVPAAAGATPQGDLRDLQLGQLNLAGAQYTPKTKTLKVFTKVTVDIHFNGGAGTFGDGQTNSPYNQSFLKLYGNVLANGPTVLANLAK